MNLNLLKKLVRLANNNPNDNEANLAARRVCKMLAEDKFASLQNGVEDSTRRTPPRPATNPVNDIYEDLLRRTREEAANRARARDIRREFEEAQKRAKEAEAEEEERRRQQFRQDQTFKDEQFRKWREAEIKRKQAEEAERQRNITNDKVYNPYRKRSDWWEDET